LNSREIFDWMYEKDALVERINEMRAQMGLKKYDTKYLRGLKLAGLQKLYQRNQALMSANSNNVSNILKISALVLVLVVLGTGVFYFGNEIRDSGPVYQPIVSATTTTSDLSSSTSLGIEVSTTLDFDNDQ